MRKGKLRRMQEEKEELQKKYETYEGPKLNEEIARLTRQLKKAEEDKRLHVNSFKLLSKELRRNINYLVEMMIEAEAAAKKAK